MGTIAAILGIFGSIRELADENPELVKWLCEEAEALIGAHPELGIMNPGELEKVRAIQAGLAAARTTAVQSYLRSQKVKTGG